MVVRGDIRVVGPTNATHVALSEIIYSIVMLPYHSSDGEAAFELIRLGSQVTQKMCICDEEKYNDDRTESCVILCTGWVT